MLHELLKLPSGPFYKEKQYFSSQSPKKTQAPASICPKLHHAHFLDDDFLNMATRDRIECRFDWLEELVLKAFTCPKLHHSTYDNVYV